MKLEDILDKLGQKSSEVRLMQSTANSLAAKELVHLKEHSSSLEERKEDPESYIVSSQYMHFRNARTGKLRQYSSTDKTAEQLKDFVFVHKNKQYSWLLTEAYEAFEDFLEEIYAYIGWKNNNCWLMSDFGNISLDDLDSKDYLWFLTKSQKKRDTPQSILLQLRKLYPDIEGTEIKNELNINLKFAINMVEYFRHIIVHKGGAIDDEEKFISGIMKKSGIHNNGNYDAGYADYIKYFIGTFEGKKQVLLLERYSSNISYHDRFGELVGYLMSYAVEICKNIDDNEKAIAERLK